MLLSKTALPVADAKLISPRVLAHLGDAVFHLYERERQVTEAVSVSHLHKTATSRTNAAAQADLLDLVEERLTEEERDLVRRARNIKPPTPKRSQQLAYRKSTAFEALIGFLYLTDEQRMLQILEWTLANA